MRGGFPVNYATMSLLTAWEKVFFQVNIRVQEVN